MQDSVEGFVDQLNRFRLECGQPSLQAISRAAERNGHSLATSTIDNNLKRASPPRWQFVEEFLRACSRTTGSQLTESELGRWRTAWLLSHSNLTGEAARPEPKKPTPTADTKSPSPAEPVEDLAFTAVCRDYITGLRHRLRSVDLEILAPPTEYSDHPAMHLESIFVPQSVRADIAPVELTSALRRFLIHGGQIADGDLPDFVDRQLLEAAQRIYRGRPPEPVLDAVSAPERRLTVLLGDPGAGKSALARYLVLSLARLFETQATAPTETPSVLKPGPLVDKYTIVANHQVAEEDVHAYLYRMAAVSLPHNIGDTLTPPDSPNNVLFGDITDKWVLIRTLVGQYSRSLQALLSGARPHAVDGNVLDLFHEHAPLAARLSETRNTSALATAVQIVTGREYTIRWLVPTEQSSNELSEEPLKVRAVRPAGDLSPLAGLLPVWIELRTYASQLPQCSTILDFLDSQHASEHFGFPKELLDNYLRREGRALFVFDGLDEVFDPHLREQVARQIEGFARRYERVRILVTSRILGYRRKPFADTGFDHLTLQDLTRSQIGQFAQRWSTNVSPHNPDEAEQMKQRLLTAIDRSAAIAELAANPLLLTILASVTRHRELPRDQLSVLHHAIAVLVEQWDTSKLLPTTGANAAIAIDYHDKLGLLHLAARQMHNTDADSGNHCTGPALVKLFREYLYGSLYLPADQAQSAARAMLKRFRERNGLLAHLGADVYGFIHRAFLDYLTADDILQRFYDHEIAANELTILFANNAKDPAWAEVLILTSKRLPDPIRTELCAELINYGDNALNYRYDDDDGYIWEEYTPTPHTHVAFLILADLLSDNAPALAQHSAAITKGVTRLLEESCEAESYLAHRQPNPAELLNPVLAHQAWTDRGIFLSWYQQYFSDPDHFPNFSDPHYFPTISDEFLASISWNQAASLYLDQHSNDRHTLTHFTRSTDPMLGQVALERLITSHVRHPDTLELLRQHAIDSTTPDSRETAVLALGQFWSCHSETLELLHTCTNDVCMLVRLCALNQLAQHWPTDDATLPRLLLAIADDPDDEIREEMVKVTADRWPDDRRTRDALCIRVLEDSSSSVRRDALEALIELNPDDELLYPIVDHARGDEDEAIITIAEHTYASITTRLNLRDAGLITVGPMRKIVGITVNSAESLMYNADATAILEIGTDPNDFSHRLSTACVDLLSSNSLFGNDRILYVTLPKDNSWRQVQIGTRPNFAHLVNYNRISVQRSRPRLRPTTQFIMVSPDGHTMLGVRTDQDHAFLTLATRIVGEISETT